MGSRIIPISLFQNLYASTEVAVVVSLIRGFEFHFISHHGFQSSYGK